jgi:hypothetical protein
MMRNPNQVKRSRPIEGHISGGRPGRPDVVMPKTRPYEKHSSQSPKRERRRSGESEGNRRSKGDDDDRRGRDKDD